MFVLKVEYSKKRRRTLATKAKYRASNELTVPWKQTPIQERVDLR